ncbi:MAG: hypothetical protein RIS44_3252 [Pseudomonadota bacterium]|jgi:hypothetical protein
MVTRITKEEGQEPASPLDSLLEAADSNLPPAPPPPPEPKDNLEEDLFSVLKMAQAAAKPGMWWLSHEQFHGLWGDNTLQNIAGPGAEIMRRNGWSVAGLMGKYGPYIALLGAVAPPTMATVQAYKIATRHQPQPTPAPPPQGGGDGVTGD